MTYSIYRLYNDITGRSYIGYESMEDYRNLSFQQTYDIVKEKNPDILSSSLEYSQLDADIPVEDLNFMLKFYMDKYRSVSEGFNTQEEYDEVSAQIIKAATQNQVDSSENQTYTISLQDEGNIIPNPNLSTPVESVISLTKSNLIYLANEHGFSSDTIVLYLYLNTIPENQFTDATLEQAAKDLDLTIDTIKTSYDVLVKDGLIEEFRTFQVQRI